MFKLMRGAARELNEKKRLHGDLPVGEAFDSPLSLLRFFVPLAANDQKVVLLND